MRTQQNSESMNQLNREARTSMKEVFRSFFPPFSKLKKADWIPTSIAGLTIKSVGFQLLLLYIISLTADYAGKWTFA